MAAVALTEAAGHGVCGVYNCGGRLLQVSRTGLYYDSSLWPRASAFVSALLTQCTPLPPDLRTLLSAPHPIVSSGAVSRRCSSRCYASTRGWFFGQLDGRARSIQPHVCSKPEQSERRCSSAGSTSPGFFDSVKTYVAIQRTLHRNWDPAVILLTMWSHRAPRIVSVNGAVSHIIPHVPHSLIAGCTSSTSIARAVLPSLSEIDATPAHSPRRRHRLLPPRRRHFPIILGRLRKPGQHRCRSLG